VGKGIYAIDAFPDDAQFWRIDWIGGVAYNASFPSEPLIDACLARFPNGETNPLSKKFGCGTLKRALATNCRALFLYLAHLVGTIRTIGLQYAIAVRFFSPRTAYYAFRVSTPTQSVFQRLLGSRTGKK